MSAATELLNEPRGTAYFIIILRPFAMLEGLLLFVKAGNGKFSSQWLNVFIAMKESFHCND